MGKVRRLRQKYHATLKPECQPTQSKEQSLPGQNPPHLPVTLPSDNLFAGLNIDIAELQSKLSDDTKSIKSQKSTSSKSNLLHKKDKLKLRREMFMQKIDSIQKMKKDLKAREKRKKTAIIGDTNPLRDALPSLESLLKSRSNIKYGAPEIKKKRVIEKAKKRKKELVRGVKTFKAVMNNEAFKKNPLEAISRHVQAVVTQEKLKTGKL